MRALLPVVLVAVLAAAWPAVAFDAPLPARLVVLHDDAPPEAVAAAALRAGADVLRTDEALRFTVVLAPDAARFERALGAPATADAEARAEVQALVVDAPADLMYRQQWGLHVLGMPEVWAEEDGHPSVVVAVIDSGIDLAHRDLDPSRIVLGWDYVDDDATPHDLRGHGTHVAGVVAATRDNAVGIAGMGRFTVLVVRVLDENGRGWCSDIASGVQEAVAKGAHVINLSLSCSADHNPLHDAIKNAAAAGVLVVAAAGNSWDDDPSRCVAWPARYPEAVAVAALRPGLSYLGLDAATAGAVVWTSPAEYSCRGDEVELAAPGSSVVSTVPGNAYAWWSGTSMATPHVAAAAALVKSAYPSMGGASIRSLLASTAQDLGADGRDVETGHGLVNPMRALTGADAFVR